MSIPYSMNYANAPPLAFDKRVKRIEFLPTGTYNQSLSQQDIVRFNLKQAKDFIDPWSVNLELTVEVPEGVLADDNKFKYKISQLDGSAQNFIQNMVWYDPQGRELERINNYGRLACFLQEMKYNPQERGGTDQYGCGGVNMGQLSKNISAVPAPINKMRTLAGSLNDGALLTTYGADLGQTCPVFGYVNTTNANLLSVSNNGTDTTTNGVISDNHGGVIIGPLSTYFNDQGQPIMGAQYGPSNDTIALTPMQWQNGTLIYPANSNETPSWSTNGYWMAGAENHLQAAWSPVSYWSPCRNNAVVWESSPFIGWDSSIGAGPLGTYNGAPPSTIQIADSWYGTGITICGNTNQMGDQLMKINNLNQTIFYNGPQGASATADMTAMVYGFADPFPANFMAGSFEPFFSSTVRQRVIDNGVPKSKFIRQHTFIVPLMSGFLGQLIEAPNYKLIPMEVMKDITLELTFNPYALFTSYHSGNNMNRSYLIKDIRLTMDTMVIEDNQLYQAVSSQFPNWAFASQSFYFGPQYTIVNNAVPGEIQINLRFKSLKNIFFGFYRSLYLKSTAARYNYRLSHNLTQYYVRYGTEVYPSIPYEGNGGTNMGPNNNSEFIQQLRAALGYQHTPLQSCVNIHNFAVNFSEFNPEDQPSQSMMQQDPWDKAVKTMDIDENQLCYFKEQRCKGTAMYAVPCQVMEQDPSAWSGIDTETGSAMSLLMANSMIDAYQGQSEFNCWLNYNLVFKRAGDGFIVYGRV